MGFGKLCKKICFPLALLGLIYSSEAVEVSAPSAIIMDFESGKVLFEKDADTARYPASTTKILTALLLIEKCKLNDTITAPQDIQKIGEASLHLQPGEQLSVKDVLHAIMLRSANDACYAVAMHLGGSIQGFAKMMNQRAKQIGCKNANFCNPNGLHHKEHKVSARDLALITREAMKNETFRGIVRTQEYVLSRSMNQTDLKLKNKNKWLAMDSTADGVKTGWTIPAGKCYVGSASRDGYRVITVVLKSKDWVVDHKAMLDWAFARHQRVCVAKVGQALGKIAVPGSSTGEILAGPYEDKYTALPKKTTVQPTVHFVPLEGLTAPIAAGQMVGEAVLRYPSGWEYRFTAVALEDAPALPIPPPPGQNASSLSGGMSLAGILLILGASAVWMRRRARAISI